jgi:sulfur-oxidizing protein SoxX
MNWQLCLAALVAAASVTPALGETAPGAIVFQEGAIPASLSGVPGDAQSGIKIMTTNALGNCVACHTVAALPDVQFPGDIAPPLDGVADRYSEAEIRGIVANAKNTFEDSFMPAFYKTDGFVRPGDAFTGKAPKGPLAPILSAQQIEDVVAYLMTLKE